MGERAEAGVDADLVDGIEVLPGVCPFVGDSTWDGLGRSLRMTSPGVPPVDVPSVGASCGGQVGFRGEKDAGGVTAGGGGGGGCVLDPPPPRKRRTPFMYCAPAVT